MKQIVEVNSIVQGLLDILFSDSADKYVLGSYYSKNIIKIKELGEKEFISLFLLELIESDESNRIIVRIATEFLSTLEIFDDKNKVKEYSFVKKSKNHMPSSRSLELKYFHPPVDSNPLLRLEF